MKMRRECSTYHGKRAATPRRDGLPQPEATSHQYRMKVSKSGLYLLLAALLIVGSIPVATRGLASANIPTAFGRVVVGSFLMFCGVLMVAMVLRSRLVIET